MTHDNKPDPGKFIAPEVEKVPSPLTITAIIYFAQIVLSIFSFYLSMRLAGVEASVLYSSGIIYFQLIITKFLPITGLVLLLLKKKTGWILAVAVGIYNILQEINLPLDLVINFKDYDPNSFGLVTSVIVTLLLSIAMVYCLLTRRLRKFFGVDQKTVYLTILISVLVFGLMKFVIGKMFLNMALNK